MPCGYARAAVLVTLDAAKECISSGCLVYTIIYAIDAHERRVDCESLLLPFGRDDSKVQQILASLQLTNVPGAASARISLTVFGCRPICCFLGRATRRNVLRAGRISFGKESMTCMVRNLSATGASIEGARLVGAPDTFTLVLEMESAERRCTVVWRESAQIGVRFG